MFCDQCPPWIEVEPRRWEWGPAAPAATAETAAPAATATPPELAAEAAPEDAASVEVEAPVRTSRRFLVGIEESRAQGVPVRLGYTPELQTSFLNAGAFACFSGEFGVTY